MIWLVYFNSKTWHNAPQISAVRFFLPPPNLPPPPQNNTFLLIFVRTVRTFFISIYQHTSNKPPKKPQKTYTKNIYKFSAFFSIKTIKHLKIKKCRKNN